MNANLMHLFACFARFARLECFNQLLVLLHLAASAAFPVQEPVICFLALARGANFPALRMSDICNWTDLIAEFYSFACSGALCNR